MNVQRIEDMIEAIIFIYFMIMMLGRGSVA